MSGIFNSATVWSSLQNAVANLVLALGSFTSTFQQTTAAIWKWANVTAATASLSQGSPIMELEGEYWNGSASAPDDWSVQTVIANGTNGASTLSFGHSGTTGNLAVFFPPLNNITIQGGGGATNIINTSGLVMIGSSGSRVSLGSVIGLQGTPLQLSSGVKVTLYNGITAVESGVPYIVASANVVNQAAAVAATTIFTPSVAGRYRITFYLKVTRAATTSSQLGAVTITYQDGADSVAQSVVLSAQNQAGAQANSNTGNSTTTVLSGSFNLFANATAIQYAIAYASVGATTMQYEYRVTLEALT